MRKRSLIELSFFCFKVPKRNKDLQMKTQNKILLGILIVLIIAVVVQFSPRLYKSITKTLVSMDDVRVGKARHEIANLGVALSQYNLDVGTYPSTEQGLDALWQVPQDVTNWKGPYLVSPITKDPWSNDYQYRYPSKKTGYDYELSTYGKDGKLGGLGMDADIGNMIESGM